MQLFLFALLLPLVAGQVIVTDLEMSDAPTNEQGYIIATVNVNETHEITSPVCGSVDLLTGWIACMSVGWLGVTGAGNAQGLGVTGPTGSIQLNNLTCTSFSTTNERKEFECTVSRISEPVVSCTGDNVAAVSCYFSIGQVAGIAAGILALCLLVTVLPFVLCCVCCCCGIGCVAANRA